MKKGNISKKRTTKVEARHNIKKKIVHLAEPKRAVKEKGPVKTYFYRVLIVVLLILLLAYIVFFCNAIRRDCGNNAKCFDQLAGKCSGSRLEAIRDENIYEYIVLGPLKSDCIFEIKLKKMAAGTPIDIVNKMEGKSMQCKVPRDLLKRNGINNIDNLISYCSGPLKESLYEVMVDRMYSLIVKNMANITKTVEKDILKFSSQGL